MPKARGVLCFLPWASRWHGYRLARSGEDVNLSLRIFEAGSHSINQMELIGTVFTPVAAFFSWCQIFGGKKPYMADLQKTACTNQYITSKYCSSECFQDNQIICLRLIMVQRKLSCLDVRNCILGQIPCI